MINVQEQAEVAAILTKIKAAYEVSHLHN